METRLSRYLLTFKVTPHSNTGSAPSELMMGRKLRTLLDALHPSISCKVFQHQEKKNILNTTIRSERSDASTQAMRSASRTIHRAHLSGFRLFCENRRTKSCCQRQLMVATRDVIVITCADVMHMLQITQWSKRLLLYWKQVSNDPSLERMK